VAARGFRPAALDQRSMVQKKQPDWLLSLSAVFSSISTLLHFHGQNSIFQLCAAGERPAIEVGNPMCRRSVPISTTSSSPFLNSPTSPFAANGSCSRTRSGHPAWRRCKALRCGRCRGIFPAGVECARQFFQALAPQHFVREQRNALHRHGREVRVDLLQNAGCDARHSSKYASVTASGSTRFTRMPSTARPWSVK